MKIYQPSRARSHEQLLVRIWACANGVDLRNYDDLRVKADTFQEGDSFMGQEHWDAFDTWKRARWLFSAEAIRQYLVAYDFLPWEEDAVDQGGYRQVLIEGALYLMGDSDDSTLEASYRAGVWHLEENADECHGHYLLDETGRLWSVPVAICVPGIEPGQSLTPVLVTDDTLTLRYLSMAVHPGLPEGKDEDVPF